MPRPLPLLALGGIVVLIVWTVASNETASVAEPDSADVAQSTAQPQAPPVLAEQAAPLTNLDGWLQSDIDELSDLRGQVVVVQFWTFGCINCKRTLANLADMYNTYRADGLEIVGVHAPEFEYERDIDNIAAAAVELGVTWPIALDTEKTNFRAWQGERRFWPRTYVVDRTGRLRFDHIGEGKYDELQATVAYLLTEEV